MKLTVKIKNLYSILLTAITAVVLVACEKNDRSFSILPDDATFKQSGEFIPQKIDIVWVIDNSGSMESSQQNLVRNFNSFIKKFQDLKYDYRMVVTSTDAWKANFSSNTNQSTLLKSWRRGEITKDSSNNYFFSPDSGVSVISRSTENVEQSFVTNALQGISGTGDERAFHSITTALNFSDNQSFRRSDAFLAVIIVSDEDDFSANTETCVACEYDLESNSDPLELTQSSGPLSLKMLYQDSRLIPVSSYYDQIRQYVGSDKFSVNTIMVQDNGCKAELNNSFTGRRLGRRYLELSKMTNGVQTSLCSDFSSNLKLISDSIVKVASQYKLEREPIIESLRVYVDNNLIPQNTDNGWTYDSSTMLITFNGDAVPALGSLVRITFDPKSGKQ